MDEAIKLIKEAREKLGIAQTSAIWLEPGFEEIRKWQLGQLGAAWAILGSLLKGFDEVGAKK